MLLESVACLALFLPQRLPDSDPLTGLEHLEARQRADRHAAQGDWARAVPLYERLAAGAAWDGALWYRLGMGYYHLKEHPRAIEALERALRVGVSDPASTEYNLACSNALAGRKDDAFRWIEAALASRLESRANLAADSDLKALHDDPRWSAAAGLLPDGDRSHAGGWRFDLDFLVAEARRMHAAPERPAYSAAFEQRAQLLQATLPDLSNDEVMLGMMELIAILDDGHSVIYGPGDDTRLEFESRSLPFKFYAFPEGIHIVDGAGEWVDYSGCRVVRFGELSPEEVLARMAAYRGLDNPMTWRWMGPQFYLRRMAMLQAVGAAGRGDGLELALLTPEGEELSLVVPVGEHELVRKLRPSPAAVGEIPRYLKNVGANFWLEQIPELGALYLQFNQVRDAPGETLSTFAGRVETALAADGVRAVIVDVRHNNGGNNTLVRPLVRALVRFDTLSDDHRIFVLTGRNTFSAAQNFVNRLERWTDAVFVGEPSSSSPNFVGESAEFVLPYSRLRGSISTRYWQDSDPGDERAWIAPHVPVELTAEAYFSNEDPVLDAVFEILSAD